MDIYIYTVSAQRMIQYCMILQELVMFASSKLLPSHGFAKMLSFPGGRQPPRDFRRSRGSVMTSEKSSANKSFLCFAWRYRTIRVFRASPLSQFVHIAALSTRPIFSLSVWNSRRFDPTWIKPWKNFQHVAAGVELSWAFHIPKVRFWWFEPLRSNECDPKCRMGPYASTMVKDPETGKVLASLVLWKKPCCYVFFEFKVKQTPKPANLCPLFRQNLGLISS